MAVLGGALIFSCQKVEENPVEPGFELQSDKVEVPVDGGQASMPYTIENPVDTAQVRASSESVWLGEFKDNGKEISFQVSVNEEESSRTAEVVVTYAGIQRTFSVTQEGAEPAKAGFEVTVTETGADYVVYDIVPEDKTMTYIYGVNNKDYWNNMNSEEDPTAFMLDELDWYAFQAEWFGMTLREFLLESMVSGDNKGLRQEGLDADRDYVAYAFGVNEDSELLSNLYYDYFKTEDVTPSDNVITVVMDQIESTSARINITTTNNDPYVYGADLASNWEGMSEEEMLDVLTGGDIDLSPNLKSGDYSATFWNLKSETEYIVFVFGYQAGKATTDLIVQHFTTTSISYSDVEFNIEWGPAFDIDELIAAYPELEPYLTYGKGRAYVPMTPIVPENARQYYWMYYWEDKTDKSQFPDETLINELYNMGFMEPYNMNFVNYDEPGTIVGVCMDENFEYGPVYRELILISKDDVAPVSEFSLEEFFGEETAASQILSSERPDRIEAGFRRVLNSKESYR